ncbi:Mbeg1-like protein [uncultured Treponema sp.]|uniref:Mbeg1-like protein n=1 Tax=uncultured Treponema sp. TaxID=162155 RepID=UPI0015B97865|nr:Mbeg1-like protein [uncultured Treponema sp.]
MDIFDYIFWRGDLDFEEGGACFNSVDALILCQLSYLDFGGIVSSDFKFKITLNEAAALFFTDNFEERKKLGVLINPKTVELLSACAKSRRFGKLLLCGYRNSYSKNDEEQFSALTFVNRRKENPFAFAAFRGTDDTIVGWKEDFNLAFKSEVKAQKDALSYLKEIIKGSSRLFKSPRLGKKICFFCGGHSKGGNLAVFAAANLEEKLYRRLKKVWNFDGPGFLKETLAQENFQRALKKTETYFPQESIVGMFFEHTADFKVLKSKSKNIMQHDPLLWQTAPLDFELCEKLDESSIFLNGVFNDWFVGLSVEQREQIVEVIFGVLESTKVDTNSELAENWGKNGLLIVKALSKLDKNLRSSVLESIAKFLKLAGQRLPEYLKASLKKDD